MPASVATPRWAPLGIVLAIIFAAALLFAGLFIATSPASATGASISGTVYRSVDGTTKLPGISVDATNIANSQTTHTTTDSLGAYSLTGLASGNYRVHFSDPTHTYASMYRNSAAFIGDAEIINLSGSQAVTGSDIELDDAGSISGNVKTTPPDTNLPNATVTLLWDCGCATQSFIPFATTTTDVNGNYTLLDLPHGSYALEFAGPDGSQVISQYANGQSTTFGQPAYFSFPEASNFTNQGAFLHYGGSISGTVSTASPFTELQGINVTAYPAADSTQSYETQTDVDGNYVFNQLPVGNYTVKFEDQTNNAYVAQWYNNEPEGSADNVAVTANNDSAGISASLVAGATVSGTVAAAGSSSAADITNVEVDLHSDVTDNTWITTTDASGNFTVGGIDGLGGIPAGSYKMAFLPPSGSHYLPQLWDNKTQAQYDTADLVVLTDGQSYALPHTVTLALGATISGTVKNSAAASLNGTSVELWDQSNNFIDSTAVAGGTFAFLAVPTGSYTLYFDDTANGNYAPQWFQNKSSQSAATYFAVTAGQNITGKNAVLATGAKITGNVKGPIVAAGPNVNLSGAAVTLYDSNDNYVNQVTTDASGNYTLQGLAAGSYKMVFENGPYGGPNSSSVNLAAQWWSGKKTQASATVFTLTAGQLVSGRNVILSAGASISGTVIATGLTNLSNVNIYAYASDGSFVGYATPDSVTGAYTLTGLPVGTDIEVQYQTYSPPGEPAFLEQWYDNQLNENNSDLVNLTSGEIFPANTQTLTLANQISGTVLGFGLPNVALGDAWVQIDGTNVTYSEGTYANSDGTYAFTDLPDGTYRVSFGADTGYQTQWWNSETSAGSADLITVSNGQVVTSVDANLVPFLNPTPVPTISGTLVSGQQLTATPGTWGPGTVSLSYQWKRDGVDIPGENGATFNLTDSDIGTHTSVAVTGTEAGFVTNTQVSVPTAVIGGGILTPTPTPTISGTPTVGLVLTATPGAWDSSPVTATPVTLTYQWKRNGLAIVGKTAATYLAAAADVGKTITVTVLGTKPGFHSVVETSAGVVVGNPLTPTPVPTITGTPTVGQVLTAHPGTWGPAPVALSYQWTNDGVAIGGATAATYTPVSGDAGHTVAVNVTGAKALYTSVVKSSLGVSVGLALTPTPVPTITGTPSLGQNLTANTGVWGPGSVTFSYQWKRGTLPIGSATSSIYATQQADVGQNISVAVTGSEAGYTSVTLTSSTVLVGNPLGTPPTPTISGTLTVGHTLTAMPGAWPSAPVTLSYQWLRNGTPVVGKTASTYLLATADAGSTIAVQVKGTKPLYTSQTVVSADTAMITGGVLTPAPVPTITGSPTVGAVVTANPGLWGPAPVTLSYQWFLGTSPIGGASSNTYTPIGTDVGNTISVAVTGSKTGFADVTKTSLATPLVGNQLTPTPVPTVVSTGANTVGQTLSSTVDPATWGPGTVALTYQWKRGATALAAPTAIVGSTIISHLLVAADAGQTLTLWVTGTEATYTPVSVSSTGILVGALLTPTPTPTISGSLVIGSTLTAVPGAWGPAPVTLSYQWLRDGSPIGVTTATYHTVSADNGHSVTVAVTGTKMNYTSVTKTSVGVVPGLAFTATSASITGIPTVLQTLSANTGSWGPGVVNFTYQWLRNGAVIPGENNSTYIVDDGTHDLAKNISVAITGSESGYLDTTKTSASVMIGSAFNPTAVPTINNTSPTVGNTLTALPGTWSPTPTFTYQWYRNGAPVVGKTAVTYVVTAADAGSTLSVRVTAAKAGYTSVTQLSNPTDPVLGGILAPTPVPTITGSPTVGALLTANPGVWGPAPVTLTYQWNSANTPIPLATGSTYTPVSGDQGSPISVTVTGQKTGFVDLPKTSVNTVAIGFQLAPTPVPTVVSTGANTVGQTLSSTVDPATWGPGTVALTYQWKRGATALAAPTAIVGSTVISHLLVAADAGQTLTLWVTGTETSPYYSPVTVSSTGVVVGALLSPSPTPTITGTSNVGSTLTAVPGVWGPAPVTLGYQWLRDGSPIGAATHSTYLLVGADAGTTVTVSVTGTKMNYTPITRTSAGVLINSVFTGASATIVGSPMVGTSLTADPGAWGPGTVNFTYQWYRNGVAIAGETNSTYTVVGPPAPPPSDVSKTLTVAITGTEAGFATVTKTSPGVLAGLCLTPATPTITGSVTVGSTLTANPNVWGPPAALPVTFTYQWLRNGTAVAGKTGSTYVLATADAGSTISVRVTGSKPTYISETMTSASTSAITGGVLTPAPVPTITGIPTVGSVLTAVPGVWGPAPVVLTYQWYRSGVAIVGETNNTYTASVDDLGTGIITVKVTGTKNGFTTVTKTSLAFTVGI